MTFLGLFQVIKSIKLSKTYIFCLNLSKKLQKGINKTTKSPGEKNENSFTFVTFKLFSPKNDFTFYTYHPVEGMQY